MQSAQPRYGLHKVICPIMCKKNRQTQEQTNQCLSITKTALSDGCKFAKKKFPDIVDVRDCTSDCRDTSVFTTASATVQVSA